MKVREIQGDESRDDYFIQDDFFIIGDFQIPLDSGNNIEFEGMLFYNWAS